MYAVIKTGGKQYRVAEGDVIRVEKLNLEAGAKVVFDNVLVMGEGNDAQIGTPYLDGVKVFGEVVSNGRADKVIIYKYKAKKDYRKKQGHRQPYTEVEITGLGEDKPKAKKDEPEVTEEPEVAEEVAAPAEEAVEEAVEETVEETAEEIEEKAPKASMSMKKDELIAYAAERGIEVDPKATKADILAEIEKNA